MPAMNQSIRPYLNHTPKLGSRVYVDPAACVIGDVEVGDDCSLWPFSITRGDVHHIRIGARTNIQDGAVLHVTHDGPYTPGGSPLLIGEGVTIGHGAILHACTIGDYCLIGMGSTILDNVRVEPLSMIAAGAVVTPGKVVETGTLWRGNPARYARDLSDQEKDMLRYSADHYVRLKENYLTAMQADK